ncbi:hypothetical protein G8O24_14985 [Bradyrhizobium sp. INPA01-394B]|uniref:Class IIb bacteriocin, lactobin A/cerein 7B family n=1 Tax=Bradyrhizobium campsiandrae TaxID=1729892 RepID=A0ABR7UB23_9BRAD|nr:hypothetical protein [Bradyrhizobium campsiandrae]MBC9878644.1 hypothetical protein [Bradyrhizobium campsiandrae]MBC9980627.1 hypothetical protein [Bradyrhizobium campsiandrae]
MTHQIDNNIANCELSMEQLDGVAGGGWFGSLVHSIEHGLKSFFTNPVVAGIAAGVILVGGIVTGGAGNPPQRLN